MKRHLLTLFFALALAGNSFAGLITIQPIRVTNTAGTIGPTVNLFEAATNKIYEQAGHMVQFLSLRTYMDDMFVTLADGDFSLLVDGAGHQQNADPNVINMFFVNDIADDPGFVTYGLGRVNGNGVVIDSTATNAFNGGVGRIDTVAHELGHNFGLRHSNFGAGAANNLMTSGSVRSVPGSLADITPDGLKLDVLNAEQRAQIAASPFSVNPVPEPSTFTIYALGVCCCGAVSRRRRKKAA